MATTSIDAPPWYSHFPTPVSKPDQIARSELLALIQKSQNNLNHTYVLVDVRRNDHEGGTIATSLNLPAQSFYHSLPAFTSLLRASAVTKVIFYCGSSNGRGPRSAAFLQDYLDTQNIREIRAYVLEGGIKAWVKQGRQKQQEFLDFVVGYDARYWDQYDS